MASVASGPRCSVCCRLDKPSLDESYKHLRVTSMKGYKHEGLDKPSVIESGGEGKRERVGERVQERN